MKVIIVGAGIGGLATYLSLKKHLPTSTVTVYESHGSPSSTNSNVGGSLGLAPNGQRAIAAISNNAVSYIQQRGFPAPVFTMRNSAGQWLGNYSAGRAERYGGFEQMLLRRAVVHNALLEEMPDDAVVWGKKVKSVTESGADVRVEFVDGSAETADLVIGADGVRSVVRECMFDNQYPAMYDGLTGVGGFIPHSRLPPRLLSSLTTNGLNVTFGPHGFFGYSPVSPPPLSPNDPYSDPHIQWWSSYESPTPPSRSLPHSVIRDQLLERHASWKSPYDDGTGARVFETIINLGCGGDSSSDSEPTNNDTFLILPRYITPRIPHWSTPSGKILLIGDAAHAMPPDSGQGVSCAAEDAVALGLFLNHYYISQDLPPSETLAKTAKAFEAVRIKRVWKILDIAKKRGDQKKKKGPWEEWIRDWIMWVLCKLPESMGDGLYMYDAVAEVGKYLSKES